MNGCCSGARGRRWIAGCTAAFLLGGVAGAGWQSWAGRGRDASAHATRADSGVSTAPQGADADTTTAPGSTAARGSGGAHPWRLRRSPSALGAFFYAAFASETDTQLQLEARATLATLTADQLGEILDGALDFDESPDLRALLTRLAEVDPQKALDLLPEPPPPADENEADPAEWAATRAAARAQARGIAREAMCRLRAMIEGLDRSANPMAASVLATLHERFPETRLLRPGSEPSSPSLLYKRLLELGGVNEPADRVLAYWLDQDPSATLDWLRGLPEGEQRDELLSTAGWELDDAVPGTAFRTRLELAQRDAPEGKVALQPHSLLSGLWYRWAIADPTGADTWLHSQPGLDPELRRKLLLRLSTHWGSHDPPAALAWMAARADEFQLSAPRTDRLQAMFEDEFDPEGARISAVSNWSSSDPEAALAWLQKQPDDQRLRLLENHEIFSIWADTHTAEAWKLATEWAALKTAPFLKNGPGAFLEAAIRSMARQDFQAALTTMASFSLRPEDEDPFLGGGGRRLEIGAWAERLHADPVAAAAELDARGQSFMVSDVFEAWAERDLIAAFQWADGFDAARRAEACGTVAWHADRSPDQAAAWLDQWARTADEAALATEDARNAFGQAGGLICAADAAKAVRWASSLPEGPARQSALGAVASAWAGLDPAAASEWVATFPPGAARDAGARAVALGSPDEPGTGFRWALEISDPAARAETLRKVHEEWQEIDPAATQQAVVALPLTAGEKAALVREAESGEDPFAPRMTR